MTGAEKKSPPRGLTLMEIMVVLGVFSLTVMLTSSIFLLSNKAQRRVLGASAAQGDIRFALEAMVREIRSGKIDYAYYEGAQGGVSVPSRRLVLRNSSDQREEFFLIVSPTVCPAGVTQCLAMTLNGSAAQSLTSVNLNVDDVQFYISPTVDPFVPDVSTGTYKADAQPVVTMMIRGRTVTTRADDSVTYTAQTSAASRMYAR